MKIYIVTSGEYSDYGIDSVYSNKENAEKYIKLYPSIRYEIEEFDVDEEMALINKIRDEEITIYLVSMFRNGNIEEVRKELPSIYLVKKALAGKYNLWTENRLGMWVIAKDEKHAIKIVNEKRVQLIATNKWPEKESQIRMRKAVEILEENMKK